MNQSERLIRMIFDGELCPLCHGDGKFELERMKTMKIYGKSIKEIKEIIDFAEQHGYKI